MERERASANDQRLATLGRLGVHRVGRLIRGLENLKLVPREVPAESNGVATHAALAPRSCAAIEVVATADAERSSGVAQNHTVVLETPRDNALPLLKALDLVDLH